MAKLTVTRSPAYSSWAKNASISLASMALGMALASAWRGDAASSSPTAHDQQARSGFASWIRSDPNQMPPPDSASAAPVEAFASSDPRAMIDALLTRTEPQAMAKDPMTQVMERLQQDAHFRSDMINRFARETNVQARRKLGWMLGMTGADDVARFSINMLADPDPANRVRGLHVMGVMQENRPEVHKAMIGALATETHPEALASLVTGLTPMHMRDPKETGMVIDQLQTLVRSEAPEVRAAAILSLARWGGSEVSEKSIVEGVRDADPRIIESSIAAASELRLQTPEFKEALFRLAAREDAPQQLKQMAGSILGAIRLNPQDHAKLQQLNKTLLTDS